MRFSIDIQSSSSYVSSSDARISMSANLAIFSDFQPGEQEFFEWLNRALQNKAELYKMAARLLHKSVHPKLDDSACIGCQAEKTMDNMGRLEP